MVRLFGQHFVCKYWCASVFAVPSPPQVTLAPWKAKDCTLGFGQVQEVAVSVTQMQVKYLAHGCIPEWLFFSSTFRK